MFSAKNIGHLSMIAVAFAALTGCNNPNTDTAQAADTAKVETAIIADQLPTNNAIATKLPIVVHKTPSCGCCQNWVDYLEEEGFTVEAHNHDDLNPIKQSLGMNEPKLYSCHTAIIDGYLVEGHVPASDIKKMLSEKPDIAGLTAPGMPMLSPGMNSRTPKDYAVLSFTNDGESQVYSQY